MNVPLAILSNHLTSADRRFLRVPPRWLDFVSDPLMSEPQLAQTVVNAGLRRYITDLEYLQQQVSVPIAHASARTLSLQAHLMWNLHIRINNIMVFIKFCYRRQTRYGESIINDGSKLQLISIAR
jgi:hypothetical protein